MKTCGIDPSSSYCGLAISTTPSGELKVKHWTRDKNRSHPEGMHDYFNWLTMQLLITKPDVAVVEMSAYMVSQGRGKGQGNFQALQAVSFYQAVSVLACKIQGLAVIESRATSARKAALGNGRLSKEETWNLMHGRYPSLYSAKTRGGLDECDASVLAIAGPRLMER